jgi:hypothetical protein
MSLFDRLSRVARAEINYAKSQSVSTEPKVGCPIALLQDAVLKTRLVIAKTPPAQARQLKLTLKDLETRLANAKAQRDELHRMTMEVRLQEFDRLAGNGLSELIKLFEDINKDIVAMKAQFSDGESISIAPVFQSNK